MYEDRYDKVWPGIWNWYDRVWPGMSRCDLVWPVLNMYDQVWHWYDQVWPGMETYDQVRTWSYVSIPGHTCCMPASYLLIRVRIRTRMSKYEAGMQQVWPGMTRYGASMNRYYQVWAVLTRYVQYWTGRTRYEQVWSGMTRYRTGMSSIGQVWPGTKQVWAGVTRYGTCMTQSIGQR